MSDLDFMGNEFDPESASEAVGSFEPLPSGWYYGKITEAEVQTTKAGDGKMVFVRLDIEGPKGAGRVVFDRMIVAHPNDKAVEIGQGRFGTLCLAAGFDRKPNDTKELLGKTVGARLTIEKSEEYGDRNNVQTYREHEGADQYAGSFDDDEVPF